MFTVSRMYTTLRKDVLTRKRNTVGVFLGTYDAEGKTGIP